MGCMIPYAVRISFCLCKHAINQHTIAAIYIPPSVTRSGQIWASWCHSCGLYELFRQKETFSTSKFIYSAQWALIYCILSLTCLPKWHLIFNWSWQLTTSTSKGLAVTSAVANCYLHWLWVVWFFDLAISTLVNLKKRQIRQHKTSAFI